MDYKKYHTDRKEFINCQVKGLLEHSVTIASRYAPSSPLIKDKLVCAVAFTSLEILLLTLKIDGDALEEILGIYKNSFNNDYPHLKNNYKDLIKHVIENKKSDWKKPEDILEICLMWGLVGDLPNLSIDVLLQEAIGYWQLFIYDKNKMWVLLKK